MFPSATTLQKLNTIPIKGEAAEQARLVACLRRHWSTFDDSTRPIVFAVPNGGSRDAREGANLKVGGVVAGVPDLCIVYPSGRVIWLEMKDAQGKLSTVQKELHKRFEQIGHVVHVAYSAEHALEILHGIKN